MELEIEILDWLHITDFLGDWHCFGDLIIADLRNSYQEYFV